MDIFHTMKLLPLLAILFFHGCAARTVLRNKEGIKIFETNATAAQIAYKGTDGSTLVMNGVDHVAMQNALATTVAQRGNAFAGIISAVAASTLLK